MKITPVVLLGFVLFGAVSYGYAETPPFKRLDRNGDRRLSRGEFQGPANAFQRIDQNGDGSISLTEARQGRTASEPSEKERWRSPQATSEERPASECLCIDTHNHLVGRRGSGGKFDDVAPAETALATMLANGVRLSLVMPMPQGTEQKYRLYLDDILPVGNKYPGRFAVLGGGGSLNVLIQESVKAGKVTSALRKEFDATAAELVRKGIVGFGEMTAEHFSMREDHPYVTAPADHELFLRLADLAARYDLPIDIHMEAIPKRMPLPRRLQSPPNPSLLNATIPALERLLAHNRKARIVWVHLGWGSTGERTVELTREMLSRHSNLYMSLRVASGMQARKVDSKTFPLDANGRLKAEWLAMFQEFPDRFVIGSDEIIQEGNGHPSAGSIRSTTGLVKQLPNKLRRKIGYENAFRVYRLGG